MASPFPGMDPYLEQPLFWPSFHTRFMVAIANALDAQLFPRYYVDVETRAYIDEVECITLPMPQEVRERYLEIREVGSNETVTVLELLSPKNKQTGPGRTAYLRKRQTVLSSLTHLVELDLLRANRTMPWAGGTMKDYHVVVSRSEHRPEADLYSFSMQDEMPVIPMPLKEGEAIVFNLQAVFTDLMTRAHYDTRIDYTQPMPPPKPSAETRAWIEQRLQGQK